MTKRKRQKRGDEHYVNNKEFTEAVSKYALAHKEATNKGEVPPKMSNYIGECVMKISKRVASKPNFSGYSYIDEMIYDAIEGCVYGLHKFDPEKSQNAFAYASTIIHNKFIQRLNKEKDQRVIKQSVFDHLNVMYRTSDQQDSDDNVYLAQFNENHSEFSQQHLSTFNEEKKPRKKRKIPKNISNIEGFL